MKSCPVCKARCFDDMDTCYGCMYQFGSAEENKELLSPTPIEATETKYVPLIAENTSSNNERFQVEYRLVISLEPTKQALHIGS